VEFTGVVVQAQDPVILDDGEETMSVETDADVTLGQELTVRGSLRDGRLRAPKNCGRSLFSVAEPSWDSLSEVAVSAASLVSVCGRRTWRLAVQSRRRNACWHPYTRLA